MRVLISFFLLSVLATSASAQHLTANYQSVFGYGTSATPTTVKYQSPATGPLPGGWATSNTGFVVGATPFAHSSSSTAYCAGKHTTWYPAATIFPLNKNLYVKKQFYVNSADHSQYFGKLTVVVDNDIQSIWINGNKIFSLDSGSSCTAYPSAGGVGQDNKPCFRDGCDGVNEEKVFYFNGAALISGPHKYNTISIHVKDRGGGSLFNFKLDHTEAPCAPVATCTRLPYGSNKTPGLNPSKNNVFFYSLSSNTNAQGTFPSSWITSDNFLTKSQGKTPFGDNVYCTQLDAYVNSNNVAATLWPAAPSTSASSYLWAFVQVYINPQGPIPASYRGYIKLIVDNQLEGAWVNGHPIIYTPLNRENCPGVSAEVTLPFDINLINPNGYTSFAFKLEDHGSQSFFNVKVIDNSDCTEPEEVPYTGEDQTVTSETNHACLIPQSDAPEEGYTADASTGISTTIVNTLAPCPAA